MHRSEVEEGEAFFLQGNSFGVFNALGLVPTGRAAASEVLLAVFALWCLQVDPLGVSNFARIPSHQPRSHFLLHIGPIVLALRAKKKKKTEMEKKTLRRAQAERKQVEKS